MMGIRPLIASTPGVGSPDTSDRYPFRFSFWDNRALAAVHGIDTGGRRPFRGYGFRYIWSLKKSECLTRHCFLNFLNQ